MTSELRQVLHGASACASVCHWGRQKSSHLDIVALVVVATLAEQPVTHDTANIEHVQNGVGILAQTGGEDNNLVNLAHLLQEVVDTGALDDIDIVGLRLNFDGDNVVGGWEHLRVVVSAAVLRPTVSRTLKLLCNKVSSRSSTRHLRPVSMS